MNLYKLDIANSFVKYNNIIIFFLFSSNFFSQKFCAEKKIKKIDQKPKKTSLRYIFVPQFVSFYAAGRKILGALERKWQKNLKKRKIFQKMRRNSTKNEKILKKNEKFLKKKRKTIMDQWINVKFRRVGLFKSFCKSFFFFYNYKRNINRQSISYALAILSYVLAI